MCEWKKRLYRVSDDSHELFVPSDTLQVSASSSLFINSFTLNSM